ncbi:predicted protein [Arabidopsis lyrata subsp. lyrata]|uniref:Predicted protein n=1 Tax=Arabidopsis lyrata subsp. lyrata TaxID=81972 RepID=D7KM17_ARALL|nr:predicted protein [Arabidopsis lyrata subsp. lyrata]
MERVTEMKSEGRDHDRKMRKAAGSSQAPKEKKTKKGKKNQEHYKRNTKHKSKAKAQSHFVITKAKAQSHYKS